MPANGCEIPGMSIIGYDGATTVPGEDDGDEDGLTMSYVIEIRNMHGRAIGKEMPPFPPIVAPRSPTTPT
jgi:hypothetical protein